MEPESSLPHPQEPTAYSCPELLYIYIYIYTYIVVVSERQRERENYLERLYYDHIHRIIFVVPMHRDVSLEVVLQTIH
jgi:hypothetical protein